MNILHLVSPTVLEPSAGNAERATLPINLSSPRISFCRTCRKCISGRFHRREAQRKREPDSALISNHHSLTRWPRNVWRRHKETQEDEVGKTLSQASACPFRCPHAVVGRGDSHDIVSITVSCTRVANTQNRVWPLMVMMVQN